MVPVARGEIHWYRRESRRAIGTGSRVEGPLVQYYAVPRGERPLVPEARGEIYWCKSKSRRAIGFSSIRRKTIGTGARE